MGLIAERYATGALAKQDPLPPGRYWIDIFEPGVSTWVGWSGGNLATVQIEKTEFYKGTHKVLEVLGWLYPWVPGSGTDYPDRAFIIFRVTQPTPWGVADIIGWPSVAPANIQTSADTSNAQEVIDQLHEEREDTWKWIKYSAFGLVGVIGLYSLAKLVRG